jgi:hypothetical protein
MENASAAFLTAVRKSMRAIRATIGATTINPELLTCAERLQYEAYLRREETNTAILALHKAGIAIKQIVRKTGPSPHESPHFQMGPKTSAKRGWAKRSAANFSINGRNRISGMVGMSS